MENVPSEATCMQQKLSILSQDNLENDVDRHSDDNRGDKGSQAEVVAASESESESSQRSSTDKDFEIVDQEDLES